MKKISAIILFLAAMQTFSQLGWVNLGREIGYDFYYKPNSVVRGDRLFVIVIGVPLQEMKDKDNVVIKYVTADIFFYQSSQDLRCMILNHLYFYNDNTYKKAGLPKRDVPITYYKLLMKLYDLIK